MPSLKITARFIIALVGTVLFAWCAAIGFWTHDHAERRDAALDSHARLILQDLTLALETRLSLGLPLAQLPEVDRLLEAARLKMTGLRAVAVLDEQGRVLFSTDPVEIGEQLLDKAGVRMGGGRRVAAWRALACRHIGAIIPEPDRCGQSAAPPPAMAQRGMALRRRGRTAVEFSVRSG